MTCFRIRDLAETIGGRLLLGQPFPPGGDRQRIAVLVADIHEVRPGSVWWAVESAQQVRLGRAEEILLRQALGVVARPGGGLPGPGRFCIEVEDPSWALWQAAAAARGRFQGPVIAVSGGPSRHVARHLIDAVLEQPAAATTPSAGNPRLSVPLALASLEPASSGVALTCWSAKKGELQAISHLCQPEIAVINCLTNERPVQPAEDGEAIESELLRQLPPAGWAVLNGDDHRLRRLARQIRAQVVLVGRGSHCDLVAQEVTSAVGRLCFTAERTRHCVPLPGRQHLHAALAAVAVGRLMNIRSGEIARRLSSCGYPPGGGWRQSAGRTVFELQPESGLREILAALENLREWEPAGRRVVVCGETSGLESDQLARRIGQALVTACGADLVIGCGAWGQQLLAAARAAGLPAGSTAWCPSQQLLPTVAQQWTRPGDAILLVGPELSGMWNETSRRESPGVRIAA